MVRVSSGHTGIHFLLSGLGTLLKRRPEQTPAITPCINQTISHYVLCHVNGVRNLETGVQNRFLLVETAQNKSHCFHCGIRDYLATRRNLA